MTKIRKTHQISKFDVFQEYMRRAHSFLEMGKIIDNDENHSWNSSFLYSISLELGCKGLLLYHQGHEFENLQIDDLKNKVNLLAKQWGHHLLEMLKKIQDISVTNGIKELMFEQYGGSKNHSMSGSEIVEILESCYSEVRYPLPKSIIEKYPISGEKDAFHDVTRDPHLSFFVAMMLEKIQIEIDYNEKISKRHVNQR